MDQNEKTQGWHCAEEGLNGLRNPFCDLCSSLLSSHGLRKAASPAGFVHSTDVLRPARYPYLFDLEKFACPLCKACFALRNDAQTHCRQILPTQGVTIFWEPERKRLRLEISLDERFAELRPGRGLKGCAAEICIVANQGKSDFSAARPTALRFIRAADSACHKSQMNVYRTTKMV